VGALQPPRFAVRRLDFPAQTPDSLARMSTRRLGTEPRCDAWNSTQPMVFSDMAEVKPCMAFFCFGRSDFRFRKTVISWCGLFPIKEFFIMTLKNFYLSNFGLL
jgi:hypothetical protein